ncbi:LacI family transcriptional regulator [Microlunatus elymi]|uniref:LacI family transcriptional regulator n=1 Tax=Microlunatus elymi TaxID=2596828 RepID=A0A516Q0D7_9ACTN|nr:LacI family DNA-binding transcriptional regulator [Microlunatus elymi]QDP96890.1 LacI family transcriptional regulator [Microlunatus elymi]
MRATVRDVAARAGVSPKTVSNVLNGTFRVSPDTRSRVEEALAALDYVPNLSARGLRNGRTGMIAVAMADLRMPYSAEMCHHFVEAAAGRGLHVQIEETAGSGEREVELMSRARAQLVDGLILNPVRLETTAVQRDVNLPPVVLIGEVDQPIVDHVWIDNVAAVRELTGLLIDQGHRRIAIVGTGPMATAQLRLAGYRKALRSAEIKIDRSLLVPCEGWHSTDAAESFSAFLDRHEPPEAVVCMTDTIAFGVISALHAHGLSVPDDVSIVGYDNITDSATTVPALTTIDFDKQRFADTAVDVLLSRIANPAAPIMSVTIPYRLIERASTATR